MNTWPLNVKNVSIFFFGRGHFGSVHLLCMFVQVWKREHVGGGGGGIHAA